MEITLCTALLVDLLKLLKISLSSIGAILVISSKYA